jgi:fatty-acyl-CoA synthase
MVAAPVLEQLGVTVLTVGALIESDPIDPVPTADDDVALMQLTSGSTGSPKAVHITHRNVVSNAEAMFDAADYRIDSDVIVSWLPLFHDMGMTGFLAVPMYFGAELVKVTPLDFLGDILLWARLIDNYRGTMTAAPNFAWALLAKRLRRQAVPGQFDLSSLRFAVSGAEQVDPAADEVDADLLSAFDRAVPAVTGRTRRLTCLGTPLGDMVARVVNPTRRSCPLARSGSFRCGDRR